MGCIIGVGIAALDVVNITNGYPLEDSKVRAVGHEIRRGGNTANTLIVLSQLGHRCLWCGTLGDDAASEVIAQDMAKYHIDLTQVRRIRRGHSPTSYITLNRVNGSRTIVHYRDLPEYSYDDFYACDFSDIDWVHFEGRNIEETARCLMMLQQQYPHLMTSVEIEKMRPAIDELLPLAKICFLSRQYVNDLGFNGAQEFLADLEVAPGLAKVCTWGDQGAYAVDLHGNIHHAPAIAIDSVVDSIGAGDTFNAGFIDAYLHSADLQFALSRACQLASKKCSQQGFDSITIPL